MVDQPQSYPDNAGYVGSLGYQSGTSDFNAQNFLIAQALSGTSTATLVQVKAVTNAGGISPVGFVDVQPMVNQVDGAGNATPHGAIYHLPYFRLQGGTNAVILDPQAGDIGIAIFASHDISSVKANKAVSNPGSRRRFDMADGLYVGGFLNGTPAQYVGFASGGITVVSPTKITLRAPVVEIDGLMTQGTGSTAYGATLQGPVTVINDLTADGTDVHTHVHGGVQAGGADTGPPI